MGLTHKLFNHLPMPIRVKLFERFKMDRPCGYGEVYRTSLNNAFNTFLTTEERSDGRLMKELTDDIVKCWLKYQALPYEYFLFNFRHRSEKERSEFETDMDRLQTLCRLSSHRAFMEEINDKYNFYLLAKAFFKREAIKIESIAQAQEFATFAERNGEVFIKPLGGSKGRGAHVYAYTDDAGAAEYLEELLNEGAAWMVEERIRQSAEMGQWNRTSVNSIRIPTFLRDGLFSVIWTRMRMGKEGSIVDNAAAGGIVVNLDPQTGVVTSDGIDESYNHYEKHPGCGLTFQGWQVPRWDELLQTVEELHRTVFNKHIYIAWDFALTDEGWVVIEGNWGQLLGQQTASQVGVRKQFHELMGDIQ